MKKTRAKRNDPLLGKWHVVRYLFDDELLSPPGDVVLEFGADGAVVHTEGGAFGPFLHHVVAWKRTGAKSEQEWASPGLWHAGSRDCIEFYEEPRLASHPAGVSWGDTLKYAAQVRGDTLVLGYDGVSVAPMVYVRAE